MDKRSLVALLLIAIVIVGGNMLVPRAPVPAIVVDSTAVRGTAPSASTSDSSTSANPAATRPDTNPRRPAVTTRPTTTAAPPPPVTPTIRAETATVVSDGRVARFVTPGAVPASVTLPDYQDLRRRTGPLSIEPTTGPLLRYRIISGADTIRLDDLAFTKIQSGTRTEFVSRTPEVRIVYEMVPEHFITHARVTLAGAAPGAQLLFDLAPDLRSGEADEAEDLRNLAYVFKRVPGDAESKTIHGLDTAETLVEPGPIDWVAIRNKYFVFAVIAGDSTQRFSALWMQGGPRNADKLPTGMATAALPLSPNGAAFDLYTGPQSWKSLQAVGHDMSNVNPYAGWAWLRPMVEPFATIVMRLLLGLKAAVGLSYGWVLVIFGVVIRLLLWPLQQSAMRTSIKMQRLQPDLAAVQKKYAKDPEGQRQAMMKLYADHGMSPFSPLMGCLPMLIPMPILFALYFVFQNTIEFRGVPFLWLPDISLKDPYYIMPILMGASMLVMSWIGIRAAPPNPQAKIMGYMMPPMFTLMFLNFASGLNMYYAVQNLVAIPQQWLLTRERTKATEAAPPVNKRQ
jgi:YidC/Oxa1 family membrane protein insertase